MAELLAVLQMQNCPTAGTVILQCIYVRNVQRVPVTKYRKMQTVVIITFFLRKTLFHDCADK